ncbi:WXG100 family type VII secretion target [Nocardia sp. NPDC127579]|uniref:WXG100 family type VII secretion target n=1 Tax=Nocardia sp. NPDC127579 TaxID=3345402 RepID=UPI003629A69E
MAYDGEVAADHEDLGTRAANLYISKDDISETISKFEGKVAEAASYWSGKANIAFEAASADCRDEFKALRDLLEAITTELDNSNVSFENLDDDNAARVRNAAGAEQTSQYSGSEQTSQLTNL